MFVWECTWCECVFLWLCTGGLRADQMLYTAKKSGEHDFKSVDKTDLDNLPACVRCGKYVSMVVCFCLYDEKSMAGTATRMTKGCLFKTACVV